jgi:hypothetical protein
MEESFGRANKTFKVRTQSKNYFSSHHVELIIPVKQNLIRGEILGR